MSKASQGRPTLVDTTVENAHCTENLKHLFPEMKLRGLVISKQNYNVLSPNFHIHVSVGDLYIPTIWSAENDGGYI